jgi:predicted DNA-binding protein (UPF0251 family)
MPRPRRFRRIWSRPRITHFGPAGAGMPAAGESILTVDEFEAIRLKDLLGLEQADAAGKMDISQPTFHRLLLSARKKVADALANGKVIRIEGGNYTMMSNGPGFGRGGGMRRGFGGPARSCMCPVCGFSGPKQRGTPCASMKCPKCGSPLVRGD